MEQEALARLIFSTEWDLWYKSEVRALKRQGYPTHIAEEKAKAICGPSNPDIKDIENTDQWVVAGKVLEALNGE